MEIRDLAGKSYENAKKHGFWSAGDNVAEKLMLAVSELAEAVEAHRKNRFAQVAEFERNISHDEESGVTHQRMSEAEWFKVNFENLMKDSFEDNIADAFIRLAGLCRRMEVDVEKFIEYKMRYNETREKLHGKEY